jgi:hypothetical protein
MSRVPQVILLAIFVIVTSIVAVLLNQNRIFPAARIEPHVALQLKDTAADEAPRSAVVKHPLAGTDLTEEDVVSMGTVFQASITPGFGLDSVKYFDKHREACYSYSGGKGNGVEYVTWYLDTNVRMFYRRSGLVEISTGKITSTDEIGDLPCSEDRYRGHGRELMAWGYEQLKARPVKTREKH